MVGIIDFYRGAMTQMQIQTHIIIPLVTSITTTLASYVLYNLIRFLYVQYTSTLRKLPGPPSQSFLYGHAKELWDSRDPVDRNITEEQWFEKYGPSFAFRGFFNINQLHTKDTRAIQHILTHTDTYQNPESRLYVIRTLIGPGLLVAQGEKHKLQRKVMNPAFGPNQIRQFTDTFLAKSLQLRDILATQVEQNSKDGDAPYRIDVLSWLSKTTLDVIGLAGFNYNFDALNEKSQENELDRAFAHMFRSSGGGILQWRSVQGNIPILRFLPSMETPLVKYARKTMNRIGHELLKDSKVYYAGTGEKAGNGNGNGRSARDLLSLLVKSNMSTEVPEEQRMDDEDVIAQIPTFLIAGHETTSTSTTWALYSLAENPRIQVKLREELMSLATDTPSMDELNALPYLDAVLRETLRLHPPVQSVTRAATKDNVLPLGQPVVDLKGCMHNEIVIRKGQVVTVHIHAVNRDKSLWGEDAGEFRPERWEKVPGAVSAIPGVWSNLLTFIGGPHTCIGWKFSVMETKAILFTLIRAFEFEPGVSNEDVIAKIRAGTIIQRPAVKTEKGEVVTGLPLLVKCIT